MRGVYLDCQNTLRSWNEEEETKYLILMTNCFQRAHPCLAPSSALIYPYPEGERHISRAPSAGATERSTLVRCVGAAQNINLNFDERNSRDFRSSGLRFKQAGFLSQTAPLGDKRGQRQHVSYLRIS